MTTSATSASSDFDSIPGYATIRAAYFASANSTARKFQLSGFPEPLSNTLSDSEIADELALGEDPYAVPREPVDAAPHQFSAIQILSAFQIAAAIETNDANSTGDDIVFLQTASVEEVSRFRAALDCFYDIAEPQMTHDCPTKKHIIWTIEKDDDWTVSRAVLELRGLVKNGCKLLLIAPRLDLIPGDIQQMISRHLKPRSISPDMVLATLSLTHSKTGKIAERDLQNRLPGDEDLWRLSALQLERALSGKTTLRVANTLKHYATNQSGASGPRLSGIFGQSEMQQAFQSIITDLNLWREGKVNWSDVSSSALLYGPPGVGKTMAAEAFANTAGIHFVGTSFAECQSAGHLGQMLSALYSKVNEAISKSPSVFFIDEIDSFHDRNGGGNNASYMRSVVNGLLTQLTRLNEAEGVIVLSATNFPERVDRAVTRAGRFDTHIQLQRLDRPAIQQMLSAQTGLEFTNSEQTARIVNNLIGSCGADVANFVRATKSIARQHSQALSYEHFLANIQDNDISGKTDELWRIAVHESGHLVVGTELGLGMPQEVVISPYGGEVLFPKRKFSTPPQISADLATLLAGREAERIFFSDVSNGVGLGPESDLAKAIKMAARSVLQFGFNASGSLCWQELSHPFHLSSLSGSDADHVRNLLSNAQIRAQEIVQYRQHDIERIARVLVEKRGLSSKELFQLLEYRPSTIEASANMNATLERPLRRQIIQACSNRLRCRALQFSQCAASHHALAIF